MRYRWHSVLYIFSTVTVDVFATPLAPLWSDRRVKHTWNTVPDNWESLGPPPAGTTIDLYIALQPHSENALVDALYEVSKPGHQKHVILTNQLLELVFTCHTATLQIWCPPIQGR